MIKTKQKTIMETEQNSGWTDEKRQKFIEQMVKKVPNYHENIDHYNIIYSDLKKKAHEISFSKSKPKELSDSQWQLLINFSKPKKEKIIKKQKKEDLEETQAHEDTTVSDPPGPSQEIIEMEKHHLNEILQLGNGDFDLGLQLYEQTILGNKEPDEV